MLFPDIDHVPSDPGSQARGQTQVTLFDATNQPRGAVLAASIVIGAAVPEPATVALLAGGLAVLGMGAARRRRRA